MPHKCTRCRSVFKDGAAIILNGCPSCGWNKFLYVKEGEPEEGTLKSEFVLTPAGEKLIQEIDEVLGKKEDVPLLRALGLRLPEPIPSPQARLEGKLDEGRGEPRSEASKEIELDRVESIRILAPGSYELNLESLFERDEIVMALKEDGTYIVHLPSAFGKKKH
jgi:predicted  nucleic acid-binding Zn-ribbon protein